MKFIPFAAALCLAVLSHFNLNAQQGKIMLKGMITNEKEELLVGATVRWKDTISGTFSDTNGRFSIFARTKPATLQVQYFGYSPAEVQVLPGENNLWIEVTGATQLKQVNIDGHGFGNGVSTLDPRNIESISSRELRKAPCCNLSESFETNGSIDVSYANAITGVKEIQLLGLRGIYSQFLIENRPSMTGIAAPFAFELIPGTWLNGIVLAKGASSVKNGNNGITGQINADLVKPKDDKPLFVNVFSSSEGRGELNVHLNNKGKKNVSNGLMLHGSFAKNRWDMNRDTFYDSPNRHQLNALYRLMYDGPAGCAQFNVQAATDRRKSGQIYEFPGKPGLFSVDQRNDHVEVWAKYGKEGLFGKPFNEIGNIASVTWHRNSSVFGRNVYDGFQQSVFVQSLYQTILGNTNHKMVIAPSLQYDDIREKVNEGDLNRRETVAGLMGEYTYSHPTARMEVPDLVLVLGARLDYNSRFGWLPTPRMSAKYNFTEKSVLRVSGGLGYRSPNLIAENISLLASNRALNFDPGIRDEMAWNYGVNFTQDFKVAHRNASFSIDAYRTDFVRQILVDVDQSPTTVYFYQVNGPSFSNSVLAVLQYNALPGLDLKIAGKWNDVRATFQDGVLRTQPLVARVRALFTADYTTPNKKWMFNLRTQIVGPQRLPDNSQVPHQYIHEFPEISPTYSIWSGQITRSWKKAELYFGVENFTNFQQHHAIIAVKEPWSPYFNGSQLWAPMMGTVASIGVRITDHGL